MTEVTYWIQITLNFLFCLIFFCVIKWQFSQNKINQFFFDNMIDWKIVYEKKGDKNKQEKTTSR